MAAIIIRCVLAALTLALCAALWGCDMIDYHPYDVRISGEKGINAKNIALIEQRCMDKDTVRFVATGDTQGWYNETEDMVDNINARGDIDFVLHGGDLTNFGMTDEFVWQRDILNRLDIPYVVLIGNHDCVGTGEEAFNEVFGEQDFAFIAGRVKFVCLNTNAVEYDYSRPIPDFEFMRGELTARSDAFDRTVVSMHVRPLVNVFNNNVADMFEYYVRQFPGLLFCTAAHEHTLFEEDVFGDGVMYYMSDCMANRNYYVFTITPNGYEREVVWF